MLTDWKFYVKIVMYDYAQTIKNQKREFYMSKKIIFMSLLLVTLIILGSFNFIGCTGNGKETEPEGTSSSTEAGGGTEDNTKETEPQGPTLEEIMQKTTYMPTIYDVAEIKTADQTTAGSFEKWKNEVKKQNGSNNDDPTNNSLISSPFHSLKVNGSTIPVYTARCGKGAHSFAWIDVTSEGDFALDISLTLSEDFKKCVILPESRNTEAKINGNAVTNVITEEGSYTYTFANSAYAKVTDPTLAPITIMVTRAPEYKIPSGYKKVEIEPGLHGMYELEFVQQNTAYIVKAGFHQISSIGLPSNSMLIIEQGAYIKAEDRKINDTTYNSNTAIHADNCNNVKIISRGLLDCGSLQGGDNKYKHVVNTANSDNVSIEGLTIINSNTWTMCAYNSNNVRINQNLLLGYRTYTDGIMMSDCTNSSGKYNFVRTGDDAIEFKATGWWASGAVTGSNCLYEYNDVWTDKGVGYGIIYESANNMNNMIFRNNNIGFAQSNWTERNAAIDCHLGSNANAKWSNITFENIDIYYVISPNAVGVRVVDGGGHLENITFKNINVNAALKNTFALRMHFDAKGGSISGIKFFNYQFCGNLLTTGDKSDPSVFSNKAPAYFDGVTLE